MLCWPTVHSATLHALTHNGYKDKVNFPSPGLNGIIRAKAEELNIALKLCRVHSSDVFYTDDSMGNFEALAQRSGSDCVEMESFGLFHNANYLHKNAACLLTISDSFVSSKVLTAEERQNSFRTMMQLALESAFQLDK